MRVLVVGGTRFIGPPTVERLLGRGHEVTLFHRGRSGRERWPDLPRIPGDRTKIAEHREALRAARPDVVLDMIPLSRRTPAASSTRSAARPPASWR